MQRALFCAYSPLLLFLSFLFLIFLKHYIFKHYIHPAEIYLNIYKIYAQQNQTKNLNLSTNSIQYSTTYVHKFPQKTSTHLSKFVLRKEFSRMFLQEIFVKCIPYTNGCCSYVTMLDYDFYDYM